jgi:hypothetical protein
MRLYPAILQTGLGQWRESVITRQRDEEGKPGGFCFVEATIADPEIWCFSLRWDAMVETECRPIVYLATVAQRRDDAKEVDTRVE